MKTITTQINQFLRGRNIPCKARTIKGMIVIDNISNYLTTADVVASLATGRNFRFIDYSICKAI